MEAEKNLKECVLLAAGVESKEGDQQNVAGCISGAYKNGECNDEHTGNDNIDETSRSFNEMASHCKDTPNYSHLLKSMECPKFDSNPESIGLAKRSTSYGRFYQETIVKVCRENPKKPLHELIRLIKIIRADLDESKQSVNQAKYIDEIREVNNENEDETDADLEQHIKRLRIDNSFENYEEPEPEPEGKENQLEDVENNKGVNSVKIVEKKVEPKNMKVSGSTEEDNQNANTQEVEENNQ